MLTGQKTAGALHAPFLCGAPRVHKRGDGMTPGLCACFHKLRTSFLPSPIFVILRDTLLRPLWPFFLFRVPTGVCHAEKPSKRGAGALPGVAKRRGGSRSEKGTGTLPRILRARTAAHVFDQRRIQGAHTEHFILISITHSQNISGFVLFICQSESSNLTPPTPCDLRVPPPLIPLT